MCDTWQDCFNCTTNGCGWCGVTQSCMEYNNHFQTCVDGVCPDCWKLSSNYCPVRQNRKISLTIQNSPANMIPQKQLIAAILMEIVLVAQVKTIVGIAKIPINAQKLQQVEFFVMVLVNYGTTTVAMVTLFPLLL